jgi:hypothetical protein
MNDAISRRDLIKGLGVAGVSGLIKSANAEPVKRSVGASVNYPLPPVVPTDGEIASLTSTSDVFISPRGRVTRTNMNLNGALISDNRRLEYRLQSVFS